MEYGGLSLTKCAYEIRGEFLRSERLYRVSHLPLVQAMKRDVSVLKSVLGQLLSALNVLAEHRIVHSDIKPDNILLEEHRAPDGSLSWSCRLIDLGSASAFDCPESTSLATPEYMPPEALESCALRTSGVPGSSSLMAGLLSGGNRLSIGGRGGDRGAGASTRRGAIASSGGSGSSAGGGGSSASSSAGAPPGSSAAEQASRARTLQPWSFDIWSLGTILLELGLGTPLWLSYKCRVADGPRLAPATTGLFAVPGRDPERILAKQTDALRHKGLPVVLRGAPGVPLGDGGLDLLSNMLTWEPMDRIAPKDALDAPWFQE
eukprot:TRINITY_DN8378_c0_g1_i2.p1 TRINITY_DN8378_c0_g1~~TRINITY_DN8378_c0_g1_i2.p1  ORF type:complete len:319 (-),score=61.53 TRINITY_DN8378_c0_g1_i2:87-1043(-)